ncbi:unnamed protein product, partial [Allacma fusca]
FQSKPPAENFAGCMPNFKWSGQRLDVGNMAPRSSQIRGYG